MAVIALYNDHEMNRHLFVRLITDWDLLNEVAHCHWNKNKIRFFYNFLKQPFPGVWPTTEHLRSFVVDQFVFPNFKRMVLILQLWFTNPQPPPQTAAHPPSPPEWQNVQQKCTENIFQTKFHSQEKCVKSANLNTWIESKRLKSAENLTKNLWHFATLPPPSHPCNYL